MKALNQKSDGLKQILDVIGDQWTALIIREIASDPTTFCRLETSLGGIPPRTLSKRLEMLQTNKIIAKACYCDHPPRYKYQLTKRGQSLRRVISTMEGWGSKH